MSKKCTKCLRFLDIKKFSVGRAYRGGYRSRCKSCRAKYQKEHRGTGELSPKQIRNKSSDYNRLIQRKYGINIKQKNKILKNQNNRCAVCKSLFINNEKCRSDHIDHCHKTGMVRGILCRSCNLGLGLFRDNTEFLETAIKYLKINNKC